MPWSAQFLPMRRATWRGYERSPRDIRDIRQTCRYMCRAFILLGILSTLPPPPPFRHVHWRKGLRIGETDNRAVKRRSTRGERMGVSTQRGRPDSDKQPYPAYQTSNPKKKAEVSEKVRENGNIDWSKHMPKPKEPVEVSLKRMYGGPPTYSDRDSEDGRKKFSVPTSQLSNDSLYMEMEELLNYGSIEIVRNNSFPPHLGISTDGSGDSGLVESNLLDVSEDTPLDYDKYFDENETPRRSIYHNQWIYSYDEHSVTPKSEEEISPEEVFDNVTNTSIKAEDFKNENLSFLTHFDNTQKGVILNTITRHLDLGYRNITEAAFMALYNRLGKDIDALSPDVLPYLHQNHSSPRDAGLIGYLRKGVQTAMEYMRKMRIVQDHCYRFHDAPQKDKNQSYIPENRLLCLEDSSSNDSYLQPGYRTHCYGTEPYNDVGTSTESNLYGEGGYPVAISGMHHYTSETKFYRSIAKLGVTIVDFKFLIDKTNGISKGTAIVWLKEQNEVPELCRKVQSGVRIEGRYIRAQEYVRGGYLPTVNDPESAQDMALAGDSDPSKRSSDAERFFGNGRILDSHQDRQIRGRYRTSRYGHRIRGYEHTYSSFDRVRRRVTWDYERR
ncbi:hypothetical protein AAMO2058_001343700 [Amorphochlora amoebiformis]